MNGRRTIPVREGITSAAEFEGKAKRVPAGALLMSFKLTIGRVSFAGCDLFPNEAIAWLRPKDGVDVDERFLALALEQTDYGHLTGRAVKGMTLNSGSLRAVPVALPGRPEQRRIADLVARVDDVIEAADACSRAAWALFRAGLTETIDAGAFPRQPVGNLIADIVGGESPRCLDRAPRGDEWGVLKLTAVQTAGFRPSEAKTLPPEVRILDKARVRQGQVIITRANTSERVGLACHVDRDPGHRLLSDLMWRLELRDGVEPRYLAYALSTPGARRLLASAASGTNPSMKKLNREKLRAIAVGFPVTPKEQEGIADYLDVLKISLQDYIAYAEVIRAFRARLARALARGERRIPEHHDAEPVQR
jgi:type I restriction enzyme S subunit